MRGRQDGMANGKETWGVLPFLRKALFHPVVPILAGALLEIRAGMLLPSIAGKTTPVDEVYSLCATVLIGLGTLWYLRRLGRIPVELKIAMILVMGAKLLDVVANIGMFNYVPLIGREDLRSKTLQAILFGTGTVLTLAGTIRLARRIWRGTLELRKRNAALLREREELRQVRSALERSERMLQSVIDNLPASNERERAGPAATVARPSKPTPVMASLPRRSSSQPYPWP